MRSTRGQLLAGVVLAQVSCFLSGPGSETVRHDDGRTIVAEIGHIPVFADELERHPVGSKEWHGDLERTIDRRVSALEARRRGLEKTPALREHLQGIRRQAVRAEEQALQQALFDTVREDISLDEATLRAGYEKSRARFAVRQIEVASWSFASRDEALAALATGKGFTPERAERAGPLQVAALPKEVLPEAAALSRAGERAVAGSADEGWRVVELVKELPARALPFDEVRNRVESQMRAQLSQEAFRELARELRTDLGVKIID